ncbi:biotin--[acetyl-CoA-carboxylase] ligase [Prevotella sp. A2931]|uniref:Biotin--[acetyl-CoA-carboxylase] ligase n=1 Tax=Prevotella illustrans TaxID=2800387 RepID=A0ABS3M5W8_9BACT|nr:MULTISPECIES: biotin--[acetyl-CoA-carboxylase] ligase [Prevotella]MBO1363579.1 biotin--[acetyl-CoA-carboxylase] ligase [Prevotella illustrans]PTL26207.1 biotin--[acetyl-CoA-carboxylase] ligase [Prevotella sp. oral taxon 820]
MIKWPFKKKTTVEMPATTVVRLTETDSTNSYLRQHAPQTEEWMTVVTAEYQTAGRGQGTHTWESKPGENLLFSVLTHPVMVPVRSQFLLSEAGALALKEVLDTYTDGITLKWPNDIYWNDRKLSGTLIETSIGSGHIKNCIFGIGLNVNQRTFENDAPNPVSLAQILGHDIDRELLFKQIVAVFEKYYRMLESGQYNVISTLYHEALYRRKGFHPYEDSDGRFEAAIVEVGDDGLLVLRDKDGKFREYEFREVKFIL